MAVDQEWQSIKNVPISLIQLARWWPLAACHEDAKRALLGTSIRRSYCILAHCILAHTSNRAPSVSGCPSLWMSSTSVLYQGRAAWVKGSKSQDIPWCTHNIWTYDTTYNTKRHHDKCHGNLYINFPEAAHNYTCCIWNSVPVSAIWHSSERDLCHYLDTGHPPASKLKTCLLYCHKVAVICGRH